MRIHLSSFSSSFEFHFKSFDHFIISECISSKIFKENIKNWQEIGKSRNLFKFALTDHIRNVANSLKTSHF